jgi:hypothetical protein
MPNVSDTPAIDASSRNGLRGLGFGNVKSDSVDECRWWGSRGASYLCSSSSESCGRQAGRQAGRQQQQQQHNNTTATVTYYDQRQPDDNSNARGNTETNMHTNTPAKVTHAAAGERVTHRHDRRRGRGRCVVWCRRAARSHRCRNRMGHWRRAVGLRGVLRRRLRNHHWHNDSRQGSQRHRVNND